MMLAFRNTFEKKLDRQFLPALVEVQNIFEDYIQNMFANAKKKNIEV